MLFNQCLWKKKQIRDFPKVQKWIQLRRNLNSAHGSHFPRLQHLHSPQIQKAVLLIANQGVAVALVASLTHHQRRADGFTGMSPVQMRPHSIEPVFKRFISAWLPGEKRKRLSQRKVKRINTKTRQAIRLKTREDNTINITVVITWQRWRLIRLIQRRNS